MTCGSMLRECIRHEHLAKIILHNPVFYNFFQYVEVSVMFSKSLLIPSSKISFYANFSKCVVFILSLETVFCDNLYLCIMWPYFKTFLFNVLIETTV